MDQRQFNQLDTNGNEYADRLHALFLEFGANFATGVPCGVLRHTVQKLTNDPQILHVSCTRESEAIGIAAGAFLAGRSPLVYMQNSGLFAVSNDIASLLIPCRIPLLFLISWRGCPGEDAIQHQVTGKATHALLDMLGLRWWNIQKNNLHNIVREAVIDMRNTRLPSVLLFPRGWYL